MYLISLASLQVRDRGCREPLWVVLELRGDQRTCLDDRVPVQSVAERGERDASLMLPIPNRSPNPPSVHFDAGLSRKIV